MEENSKPAPCGIICRTCQNLLEGCGGCASGDGEVNCHIRFCTQMKKIAGCWECAYFPCRHIKDIEPAWRGLTIGLIEAIKHFGEKDYCKLALKNIGQYAEYGDFRFKTPEAIKKIIEGSREPNGLQSSKNNK